MSGSGVIITREPRHTTMELRRMSEDYAREGRMRLALLIKISCPMPIAHGIGGGAGGP